MATLESILIQNATTATTLTEKSNFPKCFFVSGQLKWKDPFYYQATLGTAVFNAIFSLPAILGNTLTMAAILRSPSLHNPSSVLLFSLAMTDFGVGFLVQPAYVARSVALLNEDVPMFCIPGLVVETLGLYLALLSFLMVSSISFERYLALVLHLRYNGIVCFSHAVVFCIFLWLFPIPVIALRFWFMKSNWFKTLYKVFLSSLSIVSSFSIILSYTGIFAILRRHRRQIQAQTKSSQGSRNYSDMLRYQRSVFSMLYVLGLLVLSYVPYGVYVLFRWFTKTYSAKHEAAVRIITSIIFLNSSLNPILYCWRIVEIRRFMVSAMKPLLCKE